VYVEELGTVYSELQYCITPIYCHDNYDELLYHDNYDVSSQLVGVHKLKIGLCRNLFLL